MVKCIQKACFVLFVLFALPFKGICQVPFPKWVDDFGGSGYSKVTDLAVDKQNNIYVTGYFTGTVDFDPSSGVKNLTSVGGIDIFVGKYTQAGTLIWAESMGGDGLDQPNNLAVDKDGNVSIAGQFESTNLDADPGPGVYTLSSLGGDDIFVIHLDTNGNFLWANSIGGSGTERGEEVSTDSQDDVITSSVFSSPVTVGTSNYTPLGGGFYGLIVKYSSTGAVLWSISIGNDGDNGAFGDRVDGNDNIIISGVFSNQVNFNPLGTAVNLTSANMDAPFIAKYSPSGTLVWANSVAGNLAFEQSVVGIDPQNNVYFTGAFGSSMTFNGTTTINPQGFQDIFLSKFSASGAFLYAKSMGGSGASGYNYEVQCDQGSNVYLEGYFSGTINFNPNTGTAANVAYHGQQDFYLAKYDANGNYIYAFGIGSPNCNSTFGKGLAIDNTNAVDAAGEFCSTVNFDATGCSTDNLTAVSSTSDGFIAQYVPASPEVIANNTITAPAVTVFCTSGSPAAISGSTPTGGDSTYTYQWQLSTDSVTFANISGATAINYTPSTINVTSYFRRIVSSGTCSTPILSNVITIQITSPPAAPVVAQVTVCPNTTATLSVSSPVNSLKYNWYDSPTKTNLLFTGTSYTTDTIRAATTFYVDAESSACSSLSLTAVTVTINPVPNPPAVANSQLTTCSGTTVTLSISAPQEGDMYNWYSSATGGASLFTGTSFTTPVLTATVTYYAEATNSTGCASTRTPVVVTINPAPAATTTGASICPGSSATLTATSTDATATITWYSSATGGDVLAVSSSFTTPALSANTTYYAEAVDNTTGCISASRTPATVTILQPLAAPAVTVSSTTTSSVTFEWVAVAGATGYLVSIDGGQTFSAPTSGSDGLTNTVTGLQQDQSVTILVQATGSQACELSGSSTAVTGKAVAPTNDIIYVPNAFTPNGDGKNDQVHVHSENIKSMQFYIYDQWGELLFTSTDVQTGWDGTYKGTREPNGVYVYYLEAVMNDGQKVNKKGTITILR
jgi:gliding motility-associated-like protein